MRPQMRSSRSFCQQNLSYSLWSTCKLAAIYRKSSFNFGHVHSAAMLKWHLLVVSIQNIEMISFPSREGRKESYSYLRVFGIGKASGKRTWTTRGSACIASHELRGTIPPVYAPFCLSSTIFTQSYSLPTQIPAWISSHLLLPQA